ncbi:GNAT family N-acetyltransferase [Iamia sp. SCSIO 61187]|uniref:GNAT family N-acetyltransferase n=1 Tax=Iamia sp. SCSIO 61187 TaxID=2722752 RepID=UPI001C63B2B7|nr:GNAT family N-acetyltransferase [Iamia sp. SCSIO 61187]
MRNRRARTEEADVVAGLWLRARRAALPAIPAPVHSDDEVRAWFADVVLPQREVWVGEEDGVVVGLLVLEHGWVDQLYVEPGRTNRGIGGRLVGVAKQQCRGGLRLWTFEANVGARRFYERHGFVVVGSTGGNNEEGAPDVLYQWSPSGATSAG